MSKKKKKHSSVPQVPTESQMRIDACCEYIKDHSDEIAKIIDSEFEKHSDEAREIVFSCVRDVIEDEPIHYEWEDDDCPWDHSGEVKPDGYIDFDQTISEFAEEYDGQKSPSFLSGCGWFWDRQSDGIEEAGRDFSWEIMQECIEHNVKQYANIDGLTDSELSEAISNSYDCVYDNCFASDFSCCEGILDKLGINNVPLSDFCSKEKYKKAIRKLEEEKQRKYQAIRKLLAGNKLPDSIIDRFHALEGPDDSTFGEKILRFISVENARLMTLVDPETHSVPLDIEKECYEFWDYATHAYEGLYEACMAEWYPLGPLVGRIATEHYQKYIKKSDENQEEVASGNYS